MENVADQPDLKHFYKNYLVAGLTEEQAKEILALARVGQYGGGERLICAGTSSAELFVILDGEVRVHLPYGDKLAEIGPGAVLGEMALIDARPRSADAVCEGPVTAAVFDAPTLRAYLNQHRDVGFLVLVNLAQVLSGRLRDSNAKIEYLSDLDVWKHAT
jgi:CRP-like cAMP-binding protein